MTNMLRNIHNTALIVGAAISLCACGASNDSSATSPSEATTVTQTITAVSTPKTTKKNEKTYDDDTSEASSFADTNEALPVTDVSSDESISDQTSNNNTDTLNELTSSAEELFAPITDMEGRYSAKAIMSDGRELLAVGNHSKKMVSASLIKLYVAAVVYENKDSIDTQQNYAGETDELLRIMISQSDNNACNTLVTRLGSGNPSVGMETVNSFCRKNGFDNTEMNRLMLDFNGLENYTSSDDCCKILKAFYDGIYKGSDEIIGFMKNQITRTKIPAGIPDGVIVANKSGELSVVENDSAIVYSAKGDYILCIMTNDVQDTYAARNVIANVSARVYETLCN